MATEMRSAFRDYLSRVAQWRAKSRGTTATEMLLITLAPYHRNDWHNMTEMAGTMATELSTRGIIMGLAGLFFIRFRGFCGRENPSRTYTRRILLAPKFGYTFWT